MQVRPVEAVNVRHYVYVCSCVCYIIIITHIHAHIQTHTYAYTHTHKHTHTYTHVHIYILTYTHTHIHTLSLSFSFSLTYGERKRKKARKRGRKGKSEGEREREREIREREMDSKREREGTFCVWVCRHDHVMITCRKSLHVQILALTRIRLIFCKFRAPLFRALVESIYQASTRVTQDKYSSSQKITWSMRWWLVVLYQQLMEFVVSWRCLALVPRPSVACATHATEGRDAVALRKALQQHVPCSRCLPAAVHNAQIACRYHGAECFGCVPFQAMMMIAFITLLKK